jgi:glycerol-3-phosphate dehydrogenase
MRFRLILLSAMLAVSVAGGAFGESYTDALQKLADTRLRVWASHPTVVAAVRAQNQQHARLTTDDIAALDWKWRAETESPSKPMIQALMANALSSFLTLKKRASDGLYTEIIVMDDKGLNVGQSDVTSDYWQGDEDKWQKTFLAGPAAIHISDIRRDESTRRLQSQVSLPVVDPVTKKSIGAITFGIDISRLPR